MLFLFDSSHQAYPGFAREAHLLGGIRPARALCHEHWGNISEAKSASSKRDYINYYEIALKSANETKYWLCLLRDALEVNNSAISQLITEVTELANILAASILTMKGRKKV